MDIIEQLKKADQVTWDGFSDKVDRHFEGETWQTTSPPAQSRPIVLVSILEALDRLRPTNWLWLYSTLRSFGHNGAENIARYLDQLMPTLAEHPRRRFQIGEEPPLQIWLCRANAMPSAHEVQYQAQVGCLTVGASELQVIILGYSRPGEIDSLRCESFCAPPDPPKQLSNASCRGRATARSRDQVRSKLGAKVVSDATRKNSSMALTRPITSLRNFQRARKFSTCVPEHWLPRKITHRRSGASVLGWYKVGMKREFAARRENKARHRTQKTSSFQDVEWRARKDSNL